MRAARTNIADKLQSAATLPGTKMALHPAVGLDGFLSQMKGELSLPGTIGHSELLQSAAKKEIKGAATDALTLAKSKLKQSKTGSESGLVAEAKTADGAVPLAGVEMVGVQVNVPQVNVQPVDAPKKVLTEASAVAVKSVPTAAQQMQQANMAANGPVEVAVAKQMDQGTTLESKTKHAVGSAIAGLSAKPTTGAANADGTTIGQGVNGIPMGGVAGQAMQGGHSSSSSGHKDQGSHPAAGSAPQVVASSPSQLDVGVYDDTHGWLRIRAELGAGGAVNATLTSADAAHESLRTALPEMTHYLGSESVHVNSIALHKFGETSGGQPGSHGEAQQQSSMAGQQSRGDEQQTGGQTHAMVTALEETANRNVAAVPDMPDGGEIEAVAAPSGGAAVSTSDAVSESTSAGVSAIDGIGDGEQIDLLSAQILPWQAGYAGSGGWVNVSA